MPPVVAYISSAVAASGSESVGVLLVSEVVVVLLLLLLVVCGVLGLSASLADGGGAGASTCKI